MRGVQDVYPTPITDDYTMMVFGRNFFMGLLPGLLLILGGWIDFSLNHFVQAKMHEI